MYVSLRRRPAATPETTPAPAPRGRAGVGANVVNLGLTSMFTDVSSEMVSAVLPLYLTFQLRLSAPQFGLVDGLAQAFTAVMLLVGAFLADRTSRYREVAGAGYAVSAGCKLGLLAAGGAWAPTTGLLYLDRTAKGVRTAPRDALISLSAPAGGLGRAFGVHRSLDTAGAIVGPVVAFLLLWAVPGGYDAVFVTSFCFALVGLGVLALFVQNRTPQPPPPAPAPGDVTPRFSGRRALGLLGDRRFRRLATVAAALNCLTVSDAFIYLVYEHRSSLQARYFPLLFVGTSLAYVLLAVPLGRVADRVGAQRVVVGGYAVLGLVYLLLLVSSPGPLVLLGILGLLGTYYAATDGVLVALASSIVPESLRTTGIGLLGTVVAGGRLVSSVAFGLLWARSGPATAVAVFAAGLALTLPWAVRALARTRA